MAAALGVSPVRSARAMAQTAGGAPGAPRAAAARRAGVGAGRRPRSTGTGTPQEGLRCRLLSRDPGRRPRAHPRHRRGFRTARRRDRRGRPLGQPAGRRRREAAAESADRHRGPRARRSGRRALLRRHRRLVQPDIWYGPHPDNFSERFFDAAVENARKIIDAVKPPRAKFCYEMMGWSMPDSPDATCADQGGRPPGFGVHLDPCNLVNSPDALLPASDLSASAPTSWAADRQLARQGPDVGGRDERPLPGGAPRRRGRSTTRASAGWPPCRNSRR